MAKAKSSLLFKLEFHCQKTGNIFSARFDPPVLEKPAKNSDERDEIWVTTCVIKMKSPKSKRIFGATWLQSLLLAVDYARSQLPAGPRYQWETSTNLPPWIVFPRLVPIEWGYELQERILGLIDDEVQRKEREIEQRYNLSPSRPSDATTKRSSSKKR